MKKLTRAQEKEILQACIADCENCNKLIQQYWDMVYLTVKKTFLFKNVPFNEEDLEDLRNDVFLRLFEKKCSLLRQYQEDRGLRLSGWIIMIAAQTVMMYLRKMDRSGTLGGNNLISMIEEMIEEMDPEYEIKRIEAREMLLMVKECMEELPHMERLVLKLHFFDGLSFSQITKFLKRTENNIYQIKYRGVKNLKELMAAKGMVPEF